MLVTIRGTKVIHTSVYVGAWVNGSMTGLESIPQDCRTLIVGFGLLLVGVTGSGIIWMGNTPGGKRDRILWIYGATYCVDKLLYYWLINHVSVPSNHLSIKVGGTLPCITVIHISSNTKENF